MNDLIILTLLLEGPKHGYRLKQETAMFGAKQQFHNNTIYPLLSRLLQEKLISQREGEGERGQTRLLYELTPNGRQHLVKTLAEFTETDADNEGAFRMRVGLFDLLDVATRRRILDLRERCLVSRLKRLEAIGNSRTISGWPAESFNFVVSSIEREREWIVKMFAQIES
ncbi:PadR family transcriptional regulator [Edaphobacter aggregans]|uniref:PadR family transcriptional regulator n=1 Tax=Edaphobacter aggregans TaxID=570835 RepID=UPI000A01FE83|nr:PadR family transcriptional regulator [Edaphobacter aggregans]